MAARKLSAFWGNGQKRYTSKDCLRKSQETCRKAYILFGEDRRLKFQNYSENQASNQISLLQRNKRLLQGQRPEHTFACARLVFPEMPEVYRLICCERRTQHLIREVSKSINVIASSAWMLLCTGGFHVTSKSEDAFTSLGFQVSLSVQQQIHWLWHCLVSAGICAVSRIINQSLVYEGDMTSTFHPAGHDAFSVDPHVVHHQNQTAYIQYS